MRQQWHSLPGTPERFVKAKTPGPPTSKTFSFHRSGCEPIINFSKEFPDDPDAVGDRTLFWKSFPLETINQQEEERVEWVTL